MLRQHLLQWCCKSKDIRRKTGELHICWRLQFTEGWDLFKTPNKNKHCCNIQPIRGYICISNPKQKQKFRFLCWPDIKWNICWWKGNHSFKSDIISCITGLQGNKFLIFRKHFQRSDKTKIDMFLHEWQRRNLPACEHYTHCGARKTQHQFLRLFSHSGDCDTSQNRWHPGERTSCWNTEATFEDISREVKWS